MNEFLHILDALVKVIVAVAGPTLIYLGVLANARAREAAAAAKDVKHVLEENTLTTDQKLEDLARVARATHTLVNNDRGVLLKIATTALDRVARINPDDLEDQEAAEAVRKAYAEHQANQAIVDAQPGTDAQKAGRAE